LAPLLYLTKVSIMNNRVAAVSAVTSIRDLTWLFQRAGRGLDEAVVQSTEIGAVNSWLRNQSADVLSAAVAALRDALAPYVDGASVRLPSEGSATSSDESAERTGGEGGIRTRGRLSASRA
jgi:hypothetical protein